MAITALLPIVGIGVAALGLDLYLHQRAERSAGLNRWGYRGPVVGRKAPGELRIAVLGGSTAFGYGLPWFEAAPAVLERELARLWPAGPRVSVVNLGFNNEGAYSYRYTLDDFRFLDYDVACLFDGYNDMAGDLSPNLATFRHNSPVFRLTGYFPILPLVLKEKAMVIRSGGNLKAAYAASRGEAEGKTTFQAGLADRTSAAALESAAAVAQALERQLERFSKDARAAPSTVSQAGCAHPWSGYCQSMHVAVSHALSLGKRVVVVLQPRFLEPVRQAHTEQQAVLGAMVQRYFADELRVRVADLSQAVDLSDRDYSFDGMHLSTDGTETAMAALAGQIAAFLNPTR
ncbi:MAG: hypothetical protein ACT4QD_00205 [Acidobacteriota bacterium]